MKTHPMEKNVKLKKVILLSIMVEKTLLNYLNLLKIQSMNNTFINKKFDQEKRPFA